MPPNEITKWLEWAKENIHSNPDKAIKFINEAIYLIENKSPSPDIEELAETLYLIRDDKNDNPEIAYNNLEQWVRDMYYQEALRLMNYGYRKENDAS